MDVPEWDQEESPDLPEHPDYPRILAVFNEVTGPVRARVGSASEGR
ncbi:hypothetical protein [Streptomyces sp. NK08204]|nr:hypothetical protein [Streptomyces sp. NK08204]